MLKCATAKFVTASAMMLALVVGAAIGIAECPQEKPRSQLCVSSNPNCQAPPQGGCTSREGWTVQSGPFGCEDNGANNTECLDSANPQDSMLCYVRWACKNVGGTCVINPAISHGSVQKQPKISDPCE